MPTNPRTHRRARTANPRHAVAVLAAAAIGAIEVSCRLSISVLTPAVRILVIVIIASLVIALYHDLSPAVVALLVVAAAIGDVDMARRLTQPRDPRSFRTV